MKSAAVQTAVVVALAVVASADARAVTIRPDLDPATVARLELLERMRASRGIRYFRTTSAMPAPEVVQAAPVTQTVSLPAAPPAPAPAPAVQINCVPAAQATAPAAAPPAPAPTQSVAFQQQTVAGSAGTAPVYSLTSRLNPRALSGSRGATLQSLFDARSLRLYGVAPGTAPVTTITPIVTVSQAAPAPVAPSQPVCVPTESAKTDGESSSQTTPPAASPPNSGPNSEPGSPLGAQPGSPPGAPNDDGTAFEPGDPGSEGAGADEGAGAGDAGVDEPFAMGGSEPDSGDPFLDPDLTPDLDGDGGSDDGVPPAMQSLVPPPTDVPEPGSLALLGLGLLGLGAARRRRP